MNTSLHCTCICLFSVAMSCLAPMRTAVAQNAADGASDSPPARLEPARDEWWTLTLYWENDGSYAMPTDPSDRHYTNGAGITITWQPDFAQRWAEGAPTWESPGAVGTVRGAFGMIAGHMIFTPEEIELETPDPGDRPYAGYFFVGAFAQRTQTFETFATHDHLQLDLGLIGPSTQADALQREVHRWTSADTPRGWSAQLDDEPTIQFTLTKKWRYSPGVFDDASRWRLDVIPSARARLGTVYVDGHFGAMVRLGWNAPLDFGPGFLQDPADATAAVPKGWSFAVFAGGRARAVAHNAFLEGGTFNSGPSVTAEPVVGELTAGVSIGYRHNRFATWFNYSQVYQSESFEGQNHTDSFGRMSVGLRWEF